MEIGEKLKTIFGRKKRHESPLEEDLKFEVININSGEYRIHWTDIEKLPNIFRKGILSPKFATRIRDEEYTVTQTHEEYPYVHSYIGGGAWGTGTVGVVAKETRNYPPRIAPRKLVGLCVSDTFFRIWELPENERKSKFSEVENMVGKLREVCSQLKKDLPIYGTSGDLYWPRRMSHDQIVQLLKEK